MPRDFAFSVRTTCGRARRGVLRTPHGCIDTPAFMPIGTRATVKALTPQQVADSGAQILLANTYHLLLRPGPAVVARLGGLHRFMGWNGAILTDSGGFQVMSLSGLRKIDDEGVTFRSHIDGALLRLTPEDAIRAQNQLGADIIMCLDECPALGALDSTAPRDLPPRQPDSPAARPQVSDGGGGDAPSAGSLEAAVRRTIAWAMRCRSAHGRDDQALYGIVQGGLDVALRQACLAALRDIGFDGYALGGLSVGEPPQATWRLLDTFTEALPADRPRYLMGVGTPLDLVHAVAAGIDQFDCVLPTRNGRKGYAFTSAGVVRLRQSAHQLADGPLDPACSCETCRTFTRGYLRHLFQVNEPLGGTLVSLHNLAFYQELMGRMRAAIESGRFAEWQRSFLDGPLARAPDPDRAPPAGADCKEPE